MGTAYSVPRRPDRRDPFPAAWTERAVPIFSPPPLEPSVFIPIVMRNTMGTLVRAALGLLTNATLQPMAPANHWSLSRLHRCDPHHRPTRQSLPLARAPRQI